MAKNYRILTPPEQTQLTTAAADDSYDHAAMLIKTCLYHGLRNEETVTLQRKHIEIDDTECRIGIERENTKSDYGVRNVPTPDHFYDEFTAYVNQYSSPDQHIFPSSYGGGISERTFRNIMLRCSLDADLYPDGYTEEDVMALPEHRRIRPHALRHTYGTERYINGLDPKKLCNLMGHKSIKITMDLYAHLATEQYRDELNDTYTKAGVTRASQ